MASASSSRSWLRYSLRQVTSTNLPDLPSFSTIDVDGAHHLDLVAVIRGQVERGALAACHPPRCPRKRHAAGHRTGRSVRSQVTERRDSQNRILQKQRRADDVAVPVLLRVVGDRTTAGCDRRPRLPSAASPAGRPRRSRRRPPCRSLQRSPGRSDCRSSSCAFPVHLILKPFGSDVGSAADRR